MGRSTVRKPKTVQTNPKCECETRAIDLFNFELFDGRLLVERRRADDFTLAIRTLYDHAKHLFEVTQPECMIRAGISH